MADLPDRRAPRPVVAHDARRPERPERDAREVAATVTRPPQRRSGGERR